MPKYPGVRKKRNKLYYRFQYKGASIEQGSFNSAEEAHKARLEHLRILKRHKLTPTELTVRQLCVKYLEEHERVYNRYPTFIKNEWTCRNHIIPMLEHKRIGTLTPNDMHQFQRYCIENKSPAVAHYTIRTQKKIFNWVVEWELLAINPIRGKLPPEPRTEHPTLTPEQLMLRHESYHTTADKYGHYAVDNVRGVLEKAFQKLSLEDFLKGGKLK